MQKMPLFCVALALLLALAGCSDPCADAEPPELSEFSITPADPTAGDTVSLSLAVSHFTLTGHEDGEDDHDHDHGDDHSEQTSCSAGHVHIYLDDLDGDLLAMVVTESADLLIPSTVTAGSHTLIARLQDENHAALVPEVTASFEITVQ
jgi:hypothetical protein